MDAGTSAVLAGAIAGAVSLGGTVIMYLQTKRQMISGEKLQLREPRKGTYSDFLLACREANNELVALWDEDAQEAHPGKIQHVIDQYGSALQRSLAAVSLEGPEVVSEAANNVVDAFNDLHTRALVWDMSDGDVHENGSPVGFGDDYTGGIREALDRYLKEARKALAAFADR